MWETSKMQPYHRTTIESVLDKFQFRYGASGKLYVKIRTMDVHAEKELDRISTTHQISYAL